MKLFDLDGGMDVGGIDPAAFGWRVAFPIDKVLEASALDTGVDNLLH